MDSNTCAFLDLPYDRLQWAGEEYIMEEAGELRYFFILRLICCVFTII